jgi:hypothetical protein
MFLEIEIRTASYFWVLKTFPSTLMTGGIFRGLGEILITGIISLYW